MTDFQAAMMLCGIFTARTVSKGTALFLAIMWFVIGLTRGGYL